MTNITGHKGNVLSIAETTMTGREKGEKNEKNRREKKERKVKNNSRFKRKRWKSER